MQSDQLAVQLYTLRGLLAADLPGTLREVAQAGYRAVELAGLPPIEAEALRDLLDESGLRPMGSHESLERLRADPEAVLDRIAVLGCPRVIVPWLPDAERTTPEGAQALARELGRIGDVCRDRGLTLGYHNHAFEFEPLGGTTLWQVLLDELPAPIELELDVYWATVAGQDPVEVIRTGGERLRLLHMKDMAAGSDRGDVTPGDGILDWAAIITAGTERSVEWYVVEEDNPKDAIAEIARGRRYLTGLADGDQPA